MNSIHFPSRKLEKLEELEELEEFEEELNEGLVLTGLTLDELDVGLGIFTAGLCVVTGAFLTLPPLGFDLLICPKAESEIDNGRINSNNVFIRVVLKG